MSRINRWKVFLKRILKNGNVEIAEEPCQCMTASVPNAEKLFGKIHVDVTYFSFKSCRIAASSA